MKMILNKDPMKRIAIMDILDHPYISNFLTTILSPNTSFKSGRWIMPTLMWLFKFLFLDHLMISSIFINIIIKSINNRGQAMDIKDFENNFKYKLYLPFVYVANWVLMLTGPFYFPSLYQRYYLCAIAYLAVRSIMTFLWTLIGCHKANFLL